MGAYKKLIVGIAFLVLQVIVFLVRGFPQFGGDSYNVGYAIGLLIPGIIGVIMLIGHFLHK